MLRIMLQAGCEKMGRAHAGEGHGGAHSISEHLQPGEEEPSAGARMI